MDIFQGIGLTDEDNKVCRLKKVLYKLKQFLEHGLENSPRQWFA